LIASDESILAIDKANPGEIYLVTSSQSYEMDYLRNLIISELNVNPPYIYIPAGLAKFGARVMELLARMSRKTPIVTYKNIDSTVTDRVFSINKAKQQLF